MNLKLHLHPFEFSFSITRTCNSKIAELDEQLSMFREMLVAKDEVVMDLTIKVKEIQILVT